jgi:hypothetical protein
MDAEIAMYLAVIEQNLDVVVASAAGLDDAELRWQPLPAANSLAVIGRHTLANAHRNVLASFAGEPYDYHRETEFVAVDETASTIAARGAELRARMHAALEPFDAASLATPRQHARMGSVPGRRVLIQAAIHAAEHAGEAALTRQLVLALRA